MANVYKIYKEFTIYLGIKQQSERAVRPQGILYFEI